MAGILRQELVREQDGIELIASENIVSRAVMEAQGSVLTNKYAEGYPGKRYYGGCGSSTSRRRWRSSARKSCSLPASPMCRPNSGSQANQAVFLALLKPGDTFLGMSLAAGGHLTHGAAVKHVRQMVQAGAIWRAQGRSAVDIRRARAAGEGAQAETDHRRRLGLSAGHRFCRASARSPTRSARISWWTWRISPGWSPAGVYPSPMPHAHVVTTTTHKTLRGPRGGMVLTNDEDIAKKINSAMFPGLQGGPLMHVIAAKAVAFGEALRPEFNAYAKSGRGQCQGAWPKR